MNTSGLTRALLLLLGGLLTAPAAAQTFRRPVACDSCIANWFYFDNNRDDGPIEDWACATSTYNQHRGADFSLAGGNAAISAGHDVVAAADGVVVSAQDGHYDRCTTCNASVDSRCGLGFGGGFGNHVVINHGSYRVIYAHMRQGSVRVSAGDTVRCGDTIGQIGSSGCTTGAHVHFETRPLGGGPSTAFDPFAGGCSPTSPSRWTSQGPHRGLPAPACDGTPTCPAGTYAIWTCNAARTQRRRCIDGVDQTEDCAYGCTAMPTGTDDVCAPAPDADGDGSPADVDCDDADPSRYPGAMETCGDGVDQDCDGSDLTCPGADAGPGQDAGAADSGTAPLDGGSVSDAGPIMDGAVPDGAVPDGALPDGAVPDGDAGHPGSLTGTCACRLAPGSGRSPGSPAGPLLLGALLLGLSVRRRSIGRSARRTLGLSARQPAVPSVPRA